MAHILCHIVPTSECKQHAKHSKVAAAIQAHKKLSYCRRTMQYTMSVEILSTAEQLYEKSHLKGLQYVHDLESHSRSSNLRDLIGFLSVF